MAQLAINGGPSVFAEPLPRYNSIGQDEIDAAVRVLRSGTLSKFLGAWGEDFFGGECIKEFETLWSRIFGNRFSVSMNSATSGLIASMGAAGIGPGDEVIVPPWTMSATVMAPMVYGGIPVFVDIERDTFCLNPALVREAITPRTKAIIAVNLFGHPARLKELRTIADQHGILLIEDNAQSPLAIEDKRYAGTIGHIGVFSLNYHKHIHTGEGGMCSTDDPDLALRLQLIRNHGENAVEATCLSDICNIVGFNFRLTEIQAAIGVEQLGKVEHHVGRRASMASILTQNIKNTFPGIAPPIVRDGCKHVYYTYPLLFHREHVGVSREVFTKALRAEGVPVVDGYVRPLYLLPMFQRRIAFGNQGYPFTLTDRRYVKGMCPVAEELHDQSLMNFVICSYDLGARELLKIVEALSKVYNHREALLSAV